MIKMTKEKELCFRYEMQCRLYRFGFWVFMAVCIGLLITIGNLTRYC